MLFKIHWESLNTQCATLISLWIPTSKPYKRDLGISSLGFESLCLTSSAGYFVYLTQLFLYYTKGLDQIPFTANQMVSLKGWLHPASSWVILSWFFFQGSGQNLAPSMICKYSLYFCCLPVPVVNKVESFLCVRKHLVRSLELCWFLPLGSPQCKFWKMKIFSFFFFST